MPRFGEPTDAPHFGEVEKSLLFEIKTKFARNPYRVQQTKAFLGTNLNQEKNNIVAVRSDDFFNIFGQLADGEIKVDKDSNMAVRGKAKGWYYTTPLYSHQYFRDHQELVGETYNPTQSFHTEITDNNVNRYASMGAFLMAVHRNVVPLFKGNYIKDLRQIIINQIDESAKSRHYSDALVFEAFFEHLRNSIEQASYESIDPTQYLSYKNRYPLLTTFSNLISPDKIQTVFEFLETATEERGGVVIAFNESILKAGKFVTDAQGHHDVTHSTPELAIQAKRGRIDPFEVIQAIELLGNQEDQWAKEIGLI